MTEEKWFSTSNARGMLRYVISRGASSRKLRLFCCAYCRLDWNWLTDHRSRHAVELAEALADDNLSQEDRRLGAELALEAAGEHSPDRPKIAAFAATACWFTLSYEADTAAQMICDSDTQAWYRQHHIDRPLPRIIRDVFGNPFRDLHGVTRIASDATVRLARTIYDERRFELVSTLCDSIERSSKGLEDVIVHLREERVHNRGCWAIDCILNLT